MKKPSPAQLDMLVRLMAMADSPQNLEAMQYVVFQFDFKDYEQFIIECPPGSIRFNNLLRVAVFCDNLGYLVEAEAVDRESVYELFPIPWVKVEPVIMGMRRELDWPDAFDYFERLGHDYVKWWEGKRKRVKPLPPLPQGAAAPKSLLVARTRAPLPSRPVVPPRPQTPQTTPITARPQPAPPAPAAQAPGAGAKPPLRVVAKPGFKPSGKPGQPPRAAAKAKPKSKAKSGKRR